MLSYFLSGFCSIFKLQNEDNISIAKEVDMSEDFIKLSQDIDKAFSIITAKYERE